MSEIHLTPEQLKTVSPELSDKFPDGAVVTFDENNNGRLVDAPYLAELADAKEAGQLIEDRLAVLENQRETDLFAERFPGHQDWIQGLAAAVAKLEDRLAALESQVGDEGEIDNHLEALEQGGDYSITKALSERLAAIERKLVGKYDATHMSKAYDSGYNRAKAEAEDAPPAAPDAQTKQIGRVLEVAGGREALAKSLKYPAGKPAAPACGFYDDQRPKPEGSILKQHEEFHRQSTPTPAVVPQITAEHDRLETQDPHFVNGGTVGPEPPFHTIGAYVGSNFDRFKIGDKCEVFAVDVTNQTVFFKENK